MRWLRWTSRRTATRLFLAMLGLCDALAASSAWAATNPCDGSGDATAALNAALAAGGHVRLPAGTCLISGSLKIPSGTMASGAGIGRTIITASPAPDYPVIAVGSVQGGARGVDLSAVTVDGRGTRVIDNRDSDGVLTFPGSAEVRIHDIEVRGAGRNGIRIFGHDIEVSDSIVHDNFANGIFAVGVQRPGAVQPTTDIRVLRNRVSHNSLGGALPARAWDGIDIDPVTADCLVEGNVVAGNDIILFDNGKFGPGSRGHRVLDNVIQDSVANGINVAGYIADFKLIGNRIERTRGFGIVVNGPAAGGEIARNVILGTTKDGILVDNWIHLPGKPHDIDISGNVVEPGASAGKFLPVVVRAGATGVRVTGNRVRLGGIDMAGAGSGNLVQGNR